MVGLLTPTQEHELQVLVVLGAVGRVVILQQQADMAQQTLAVGAVVALTLVPTTGVTVVRA